MKAEISEGKNTRLAPTKAEETDIKSLLHNLERSLIPWKLLDLMTSNPQNGETHVLLVLSQPGSGPCAAAAAN